MEFALFRLGVKSVFAELAENLADMLAMRYFVRGVDQDIVEVDDHANIEKISEDGVNKPLERSGGVRETEWHNEPFIGAIARAERSLPFIAFSDADQMVRMPEIDFGVDLCVARGIQEVRDAWERVAIFLRDLVESSEVNAKTEGTILLADEEDWSSVSGGRGMDKTVSKVLIKESTE
jgi:hypothetical protein